MIASARKALLIAAFTVTSCSSPAIPAATPTRSTLPLRMYSTVSTAPLLSDLAAGYSATYPDITLDVITANYDTLTATVSNERGGYFLTNHLPPDSPLWAAPVGQGGVAVIVHPSNAIQALTTQQVRDIYQGYTSNWRAFGGADLPIQVVSREGGAATHYEFERLLMGNRETKPGARVAPSSRAMVDIVSTTPGAVGYLSVGYPMAGARAVAVGGILPTPDNIRNGIYPLRSLLYMVGAGEPTGEYRAFIGWVQGEAGQAVVSRHYVPLLNR